MAEYTFALSATSSVVCSHTVQADSEELANQKLQDDIKANNIEWEVCNGSEPHGIHTELTDVD